MASRKLNCWEYMQCGREPGGSNALTKGVCPASTSENLDGVNFGKKGGRICWLVAGTFCDGKIQGTFAEKKESCRECSFYKEIQAAEVNTSITLGSINIFATSHVGLVRKENEDRYLIRQFEDGSLLLAIADGLGGHEAGDYAAEVLRGKLANMSKVPDGAEQQALYRLAVEADRIILQLAEEHPELEGMGTTLLCILLREGQAYWVHVGDSRFSIWRNNKLIQITKDQNLARFLVEEGTITQEEIPCHYSRHILDQALGSAMEEPETGRYQLCPGDILLLTTDGLHSEVSEEKIVLSLQSNENLEAIVKKLIKGALDKGGKDNITILAAKFQKA